MISLITLLNPITILFLTIGIAVLLILSYRLAKDPNLGIILIAFFLPFEACAIAFCKEVMLLVTSRCTESGVMPCSVLYAVCKALLRSVSPIAAPIDCVILSAYISTLASTLRAARPIV